jgi:hypothetical protein
MGSRRTCGARFNASPGALDASAQIRLLGKLTLKNCGQGLVWALDADLKSKIGAPKLI